MTDADQGTLVASVVCVLLLCAVVWWGATCGDDPDEGISFDYESELQHCMSESDHQFKVCVDDMTTRFRQTGETSE